MTVLATLPVGGRAVTLRTAVRADVPVLVALLADDDLGRGRETTPETAGNAQRFYGRLGFRASHEGLKLSLRSS